MESPENGKKVFKGGNPHIVVIKEGDPIILEGTVDDTSITHVTLFMNDVPIKIKANNGRFKRKVFIPRGRITTFRVMARAQDGTAGYSALHTVYVQDNPRTSCCLFFF